MQTGATGFSALAQLASSAAQRQRAEAGEDSLRETARQFEALFIKQLLSEVKVAGSLGGGENAQSDYINSMWRDRISQQMSQGEGLGLAAMLSQQLGGEAAQPPARNRPVPLVDLNARGAALYRDYGRESERFGSRQDFVSQLRPLLEQAADELGISPRVLLAQAALETGWGRHLPQAADGSSSRNLFGIKADAGWSGETVNSPTREFINGREEALSDGFRRYASFAESVRDYVDFLRSNPRYQQALAHGGSDENFLRGLKSAGYATDPEYVDKVIGVAHSPAMSRYWNET